MTALAGAGRWRPWLVDAARGGDEEALVSLIAAAQPDVRRYAARNCRAADIDDAVQETLLLLYRRIGTLRAVTFIFGVAVCGRTPRLPSPAAPVDRELPDDFGRRCGSPSGASRVPKTFGSIFPAPSSRCPIIIAK